ncbi:hypothetical protein [Azospira restricta]|uniref:Uncharacterized protein n=1 Tax=Azospira restricta TaxID=404405 RepID=A0A974SRZ5_9RHOO|nr:hypothetical protein [Azospira restricta]QRJ65324.1 hypothetical protein IWH25_08380 [Azospira restricta]
MERWITRSVALLCAAGGLGLFWAFGAFTAIPVRDGRLLAMSGIELQLAGIPLVAGGLVAWGALHLFALADREPAPGAYRLLRLVYFGALLAAAVAGAVWSTGRVLAS